MKLLKEKIYFYIILFCELISLKIIIEFLWKKDIISRRSASKKVREPVSSNKIYVLCHEWGGYDSERTKKIRNGPPFLCGLKFQINRFTHYKGKKNIDLTISVSDSKYRDWSAVQEKVDSMLLVSNAGFDFSGYATFYGKIKNRENSYVILSNSSVNALEEDFLDGYINFMDNNLDVGMLGISYSTKCYQSLIRNNFRPHLQSFFLLTTIDVLNDIVKSNKNKFPGQDIFYKLLLIRKGEIRLSEITLNLGYTLAVVLEDGSIFKFCNGTKYAEWKDLPKGDVRLFVKHPNKINSIKAYN